MSERFPTGGDTPDPGPRRMVPSSKRPGGRPRPRSSEAARGVVAGSLSLAGAARRLGVSPESVRRWSDKGLIEFWRTPGGQRRFHPEALDSFLASRTQEVRQRPLGEDA